MSEKHYLINLIFQNSHLNDNIYVLIRKGNRHLAAKLIANGDQYRHGSLGFNDVHKESLTLDTKEYSIPLKKISIRKKSVENRAVS